MKPTTKVSIGGLAFNLEDDSYDLISNYLETLNRHFAKNAEKNEIIKDIEDRMSELLMMRLTNAETSVSKEVAEQVIGIMGNPKDFGDDEVDDKTASEESAFDNKDVEKDADNGEGFAKKRLYRDPSHQMISGICSGLAYYLRIDPAIIRIGLVLLLIILYSISFKASMILVLIYGVLSLIIPKPKTFEEKIAMTGKNPSIENIEDRTYISPKKYRGSFIVNVIKVILKVIAIIAIVVIIISLASTVAALAWMYFDTEVLNVRNYMILAGIDSSDFLIASIVILTLPAIGLLAFLIKLVASSKFTTSSFVCFTVGLLVWTGAMAYIATKTVSLTKATKHESVASSNTDINCKANTLYIALGNEYKDAIQQPHVEDLYYTDRADYDGRSFYILPEINIVNNADSTATTFVLEIYKQAYGKTLLEAETKTKDLAAIYTLTDSLITIKPEWYNVKHTWTNDKTYITIKKPANKTVVLEHPLQQNYHESIKEIIHLRWNDNDRYWDNNNSRWHRNWDNDWDN